MEAASLKIPQYAEKYHNQDDQSRINYMDLAVEGAATLVTAYKANIDYELKLQ